MKKLLLLLCMVVSTTMVAQEKITEGMMVLSQTISSDNEEVNSQLAMLGDMTTSTYFKDSKSRSEVSNMMTGDVTTIIDNDSKQMLMIMKNPMVGNKYMLKSMDLSDEDAKNITVKKGEATKDVLGYTCQQYLVTFKKDDQEISMELYTTDKIPVTNQMTSGFGDQLDGFPLYSKMEMEQMGAKMTIITEVTEIKKQEVEDAKFDMTPPEGYEKMAEN